MNYSDPPFQDRRDAGRQLAAALQYLKESAPVVFALPRGGVPVAFEVAQALHAPLDVLLVRKIGAPCHPEVGIGAVAEGAPGQRFLDEDAAERMLASDSYLDAEEQRQMEEIGRRRELYRSVCEPVDANGRTVIVVDDGVANGGTMKAALKALAAAGPERLIFAVPVAPQQVLPALYDAADDGICLLSPRHFRAVSLYYEDFTQTTDDEVIDLLRRAARTARGATIGQESDMRAIPEKIPAPPEPNGQPDRPGRWF